eukprot:COSAG02_NODE_93_length_37477_cov_78.101129_12_plen_98_part_00
MRLDDELLEVNGEAVHTVSRANAIIMQRVNGSGSARGHGDFIELVLSRTEQPPENVTPRSSAGHSANPDGHESRVARGGSRARRLQGGCCGARPTTD